MIVARGTKKMGKRKKSERERDERERRWKKVKESNRG